MNRFSTSVLATASSAVMVVWTECGLAQTFSITDLGSLGGSFGAIATSVNDSGDVTGNAYIPTNQQHAFLYSNGVMQDLGTLGGQNSEGTGINASGQITGNSALSSGIQHAFLYENGVMNDLGTLGGTDSSAAGINDLGQVTGTAELGGAQIYDVFVYSHGVMNDLGAAPGVNGSDATAINASGQVVGVSVTSTGANNAFLFSNGGWQDLGTFGGRNSIASGINSSGEVVGYADTTSGFAHAYLYSNGVMHDLGTLSGDNSSIAAGINDNEQIVGQTYMSDNPAISKAFLAFGGNLFDLNTLIDPGSQLKPFVSLYGATAISNAGYIVAYGNDSRIPCSISSCRAYLLTLETNAPMVTPVVTGTLGANGWYISRATTLAWNVTGFPLPTTSGCGTVVVAQTGGNSYSCTATNASGTTNGTRTIKEDSVKPSIAIKRPAANAIYSLNEKVLSSYSCLDATSGVASCSGTVANGVGIITSSEGTQTFTVTGTDNAGNRLAKSVLYTIESQTSKPVFSVKAGTYTKPQTVKITDATSGAAIYYTTNGKVPTTSSSIYGSPVAITSTKTLRAMAIAPGDAESVVESARYTIN